MLIQLSAYPVFGSLSMLVQAHESTSTGRSYTRLIQECIEMPPAIDETEPWDLVWCIRTELDRHLERRPLPGSAPDQRH